jgi:hypothetical protein
MARRKETIWQRDFSFGAIREEAVERDDTPLIERSCKEMKNTITTTTGQPETRPGLMFVNPTAANNGVEVDLGDGRVFDLHIVPTGLIIYDEAGAVEYTGTLTWTAAPDKYSTYVFDDIEFWVLADPDSSSILIGSKYFPIQALIIDESATWTFGQMSFATGLSGVIQQPYWRYYEAVTIEPSARTGTITVTASIGIWQTAHVGMAIRYLDREIILGTQVSSTVMNATVTEELPPTYDIVVASSSNYQVGEAVEHELLGGKGIITGISGTTITVLATSSYDGFNAASTPKLVAPNAAQVISSVSAASTPAATFLWDMQMQSIQHGYAGYAARHSGRFILCDFPGAPQAYAVSVVNAISDFKMGGADADGFVETVGSDTGGALKYVVSTEDLIFLTTKGIYYHQTRDGSALTPRTIRPVRFSRIGCAILRPVTVDDGCVFVDAVGQQVFAAVLSGDAYKSWRVQALTKYHSHLIDTPISLGATSSGSEKPENFIYVVNRDGTTAVCQWDRDDNSVSWRPWETDGDFLAIYQCFGSTWAVINRTINSVALRFRERFEFGIVMDCVAAVQINGAYPEGQAGVVFDQGVTAFATHLDGHTVSVFMEDWDLGDFTINAAGKPVDVNSEVIDYPDYVGIAQIGLNFETLIVPWSRRSVATQRGTREVKRLISMFITVQDSTSYEVDGFEHGAYRVGEDLTVPPPRRSEQIKVTFVGKEGYEGVPIKQTRPGHLRILKIGYRVVI